VARLLSYNGRPVTTPDVSVITTVLNAVSTLPACLESVARQKGLVVEHIVVDGGSTDGGVDLLADKDRFTGQWISEPDRGIAHAMNKGIRMAAGEWLYFLQADDRLASPDALASLFQNRENGAGIISGNVRLHFADTRTRIFKSHGRSMKMPFKTTIPHQGALIRKSLFATLGQFDETLKVAMDYDWFLRAYWSKVPVRQVDVVVAEMSGAGISSQLDWPSLAARFREERKVHFKQAPNALWQLLYHLYWIAYFPFRKARFKLSR